MFFWNTEKHSVTWIRIWFECGESETYIRIDQNNFGFQMSSQNMFHFQQHMTEFGPVFRFRMLHYTIPSCSNLPNLKVRLTVREYTFDKKYLIKKVFDKKGIKMTYIRQGCKLQNLSSSELNRSRL